MAEFTIQQRNVLFNAVRSDNKSDNPRFNLIDSIHSTGKSQVLTRAFLEKQGTPTDFKCIYVCANSITAKRVIEQLNRITGADWSRQLIGTLPEIAYRLLEDCYLQMSYTKLPKIVSDTAAAEERMAAKQKAEAVCQGPFNPIFFQEWNKEFLKRMQVKNLASPRSLTLELERMFETQFHHHLTYVQTLIADDVHDYTVEELIALTHIQAKMSKVLVAGNTNLAPVDRIQDIDSENWFNFSEGNGITKYNLTTCFGITQTHGALAAQLTAFNSKKNLGDPHNFTGDPANFFIYEVTIPELNSTAEVIKQFEAQLQIGIRGKLMGVIMRTVEDVRTMARALNKPPFILWDKNLLWNKITIPQSGVVITTPYEAPYLNLDYAIVPHCITGYWPYTKERNIENARRLFLRIVSSPKSGIAFLVPDSSNGILVSPFISEANNPKLTTKSIQAGS